MLSTLFNFVQQNLKTSILILLFLAIIILIFMFIKSSFFSEKPAVAPFSVAFCQTIGTREVQEDKLDIAESPRGLFAVVSDGIGRRNGGKISSKIAIETFVDLFERLNPFDNPEYFFKQSYNIVNREILKFVDEDRCGACVSCVLIEKNVLYYAVVGNVKIAVYRKGDLVPISNGHTLDALAKEKFIKGEISKNRLRFMLNQTRVYNYVGQDGFKDIEIYKEPIQLQRGDIVAIFTDGVYNTVSWMDIEGELSQKTDINMKATNIIEQVKKEPDEKDNATVVLIKVN